MDIEAIELQDFVPAEVSDGTQVGRVTVNWKKKKNEIGEVLFLESFYCEPYELEWLNLSKLQLLHQKTRNNNTAFVRD